MQFIGCFDVRLLLFRTEHRFELLDELSTGHDFDPEGADQLDRAGIDARDVGDVVPRRILHGDAFRNAVARPVLARPSDGRGHERVLFFPAAVDDTLSGERVEFRALDGMHDLGRLAGRGDVVEPAA